MFLFEDHTRLDDLLDSHKQVDAWTFGFVIYNKDSSVGSKGGIIKINFKT
jgi:hypothetical protein